MTDTTQTPQSNAPTFASVLQDTIELGTAAGKGADTQVKFDLKIAEAAYLGVIDTSAHKHGNEVNDATKLAEAYVKAQQGAVIFDAKAPNQRKLVSNVQKMIKLGGTPKWGQGEPLGTINALVTLRQNIRKAPNGKKVDDAHNMLMRFATAQLKSERLIEGDELKVFVFKRESDPRSAEEVLEAIRKMANNLKAGKVANCPDLDNSAEVTAIVSNCTKRLVAIAKAKGTAQAGGTP